MYFVFRVDASNEIGFGHLMRCLTLADGLRNYQIKSLFICQNSVNFSPTVITNRGHEIITISSSSRCNMPLNESEDAQGCLDIMMRYKPTWLVVDHYQLGSHWQQTVHESLNHTECCLLVIDDLCRDLHYATILLDQSLGRKKRDIPHNSEPPQLLLGVNFALLKPEFHQLRAQALTKRKTFKPEHLLISIGATDPLNLTSKVLESLDLVSATYYPKVTVVLSRQANNHCEVSKLVSSNRQRNVTLCSDTDQMAQLILDADFAIGACGTTSWERACLGLPCISFVVAPNQQYLGQVLSQHKLCHVILANASSQHIADELIKLSRFDQAYLMSRAGFDLVDGLGTRRVITEMLKRTFANINLRPFNQGDMPVIFAWQQEPNIRQFARNPNPPSWDEHQAWFKKVLVSKDHSYIIEWNNQASGLIRLTEKNDHQWEVSILVAQAYHGLGIASKALKLLQQKHKVVMLAEIDPNNTASKKLFTRADFFAISDRQYRYTGVK